MAFRYSVTERPTFTAHERTKNTHKKQAALYKGADMHRLPG
ncbi:hypothetical protein C4J92_0378 [Pseudomonas sp. R3-18-08]|nr:hypothetical protein C4J92_0378 [Pseudomonas sp. R3-18-08]